MTGQLSTGDVLRDQALELVEANADDEWKEAAGRAVRWLARTAPELTSEDVIHALDIHYPELSTHEPRALGSIMKRAKRDGFIEPTDRFVKAQPVSRHSGTVRVWRSMVHPTREGIA